jgi:hypothetical protein
MSNLTVKGNASGTGTVILEAPNTNSNRTITLPDAATTLVGTADFASQAQAQAGTDSTKLMTPLRAEEHMTANALGWGQTWQDVTASRAFTTVYQNTTGRPISVAIYTYSLNTARLQVSSDNATWITVSSGGGYGNLGDEKTASAIVPNNYYYRYTNQGGNPLINTWAELR